MMSRRKVRIVTLIILALITCAALLGWDVVFEQTLNDKFVDQSTHEMF